MINTDTVIFLSFLLTACCSVDSRRHRTKLTATETASLVLQFPIVLFWLPYIQKSLFRLRKRYCLVALKLGKFVTGKKVGHGQNQYKDQLFPQTAKSSFDHYLNRSSSCCCFTLLFFFSNLLS